MKFYRGNRIDGEFDQDLIALADQFWPSPQGASVLRGAGRPLDMALRDFLTDPEGFNSTWEDEAGYEELFQLVRDRWPNADVPPGVDESSPEWQAIQRGLMDDA